MIHPSQMSYPPTENASQTPSTIVPPMPMPTAAFPTLAIGPRRRVSSGVSTLLTATIRTQKRTIPATNETALSTWSASNQSSKLTRGILNR